MKIALAQINTTVGDIRGNLGKILASYRQALGAGAELVLCPELCIPGYPPWDLLEQTDFVSANLRALRELARGVGRTGLIVGYADINPSKTGKPLFNAAALLHQGRIAARRFKTLLPTYDVFDEGRYFESAKANPPIPFRGRRLGLTLCEDAWNDPDFWPKRLYHVDPVQRQVRQGAQILLNIAASPYHRGKVKLRLNMLKSHATKAKHPFLYCALVGGNDELLFDGNSFALDSRGRLLAHAPAFTEDLLLVDAEAKGGLSWDEPADIEQVYQALVMGIRDYAAKCGFKDALVGVSGGIDSAVVCTLAADALGPEHVTGVALPSMYSSPGSLTHAQALIGNLGARFLKIPITGVFHSMTEALSETFLGTQEGLAEQNLQARIRGTLLMALSNKWRALLLSTGNKSELSVGYCTLYGDMTGGLAVIGDLPKTTVYELARLLNREHPRIPQASIDKPPSAELKPDQKDLDDLPPYEVLDKILRAYVEEGLNPQAIAHRGMPRSLVDDILARVDRSEYKRRQAPPVLKITPKAFGVGRRMPIARGNHRTNSE